MASKTFEAISVWETICRRRILIDVEGAARWMLEKWPKHVVKPKSFGRALKACLTALDGSGGAAAARQALIKVFDEAGILDRA